MLPKVCLELTKSHLNTASWPSLPSAALGRHRNTARWQQCSLPGPTGLWLIGRFISIARVRTHRQTLPKRRHRESSTRREGGTSWCLCPQPTSLTVSAAAMVGSSRNFLVHGKSRRGRQQLPAASPAGGLSPSHWALSPWASYRGQWCCGSLCVTQALVVIRWPRRIGCGDRRGPFPPGGSLAEALQRRVVAWEQVATEGTETLEGGVLSPGD